MGKNKKKLEQKWKDIKLPSRKDYQPSRKELREEFDMPGADIETVRKGVFPTGKGNRGRLNKNGADRI